MEDLKQLRLDWDQQHAQQKDLKLQKPTKKPLKKKKERKIRQNNGEETKRNQERKNGSNTMKVKEKKIFWENSKESNFELHKTDITIVSYDIVNNVANL